MRPRDRRHYSPRRWSPPRSRTRGHFRSPSRSRTRSHVWSPQERSRRPLVSPERKSDNLVEVRDVCLRKQSEFNDFLGRDHDDSVCNKFRWDNLLLSGNLSKTASEMATAGTVSPAVEHERTGHYSIGLMPLGNINHPSEIEPSSNGNGEGFRCQRSGTREQYEFVTNLDGSSSRMATSSTGVLRTDFGFCFPTNGFSTNREPVLNARQMPEVSLKEQSDDRQVAGCGRPSEEEVAKFAYENKIDGAGNFSKDGLWERRALKYHHSSPQSCFEYNGRSKVHEVVQLDKQSSQLGENEGVLDSGMIHHQNRKGVSLGDESAQFGKRNEVLNSGYPEVARLQNQNRVFLNRESPQLGEYEKVVDFGMASMQNGKRVYLGTESPKYGERQKFLNPGMGIARQQNEKRVFSDSESPYCGEFQELLDPDMGMARLQNEKRTFLASEGEGFLESGMARRSIKERLGRRLLVRHPRSTLPWDKIFEQAKSLRAKYTNYYDEDVNAQEDDSPRIEVKRTRAEPPEDSEEFKKLVHGAFFKFIKLFNENSAARRNYTENLGTGTFKCCVCGRKSSEFVDTKRLAIHAYHACKVGLRAHHLGLHRALCTLMGWNSKASSYGLWIQKMLPADETLALKSDLIIWPPVVIIHNSSIENNNSKEQVIINTDELRAILKDMGFSQRITKVCYGKPASKSIMVVSFHGSFSGLQEAERLHNLYADNKHGRDDFQDIDFSCSNFSGETQKAAADKVENILYGYLGIASDLDELDSETKKRCVVKSKKEIKAIADAR